MAQPKNVDLLRCSVLKISFLKAAIFHRQQSRQFLPVPLIKNLALFSKINPF